MKPKLEPPALRVDILTLLPACVESVLQGGVLGRAIRNGIVRVNIVALRDFGMGKHKICDDSPAGGGEGLVLRPEPIAKAFDSIERRNPSRSIYLSPQGKRFDDVEARRLSGYKHLIFLCGRYEGVDERAIERDIDEEVSIGDFILSGGELAALTVVDAVARYVPGVLGNKESNRNESFVNGMLEGPVYTKPRIFEGREVPQELLSGNHAAMAEWKRKIALERTRHRRKDLLSGK